MKTIGIIQARIGSTRLPGKVMKCFTDSEQPLLRWTYNAVSSTIGIDKAVIATSTLPADDIIQQYCLDHNIACFRGSETDVLDRFYQCAKEYNADIVLRLTADCPFLDPKVIGEVIQLRARTNADYASNCYPPSYPDGLDTECFTIAALGTAWSEATSKVDRDCLTQFIVRNRDRFKIANLDCPLPGLINEHWVCDSPEDFDFCDAIAQRLWGKYPTLLEILKILDNEPELRKINSKSIRNERFYEAIANEPLSPRTFERSNRIFQRASKVIPTGSQTYSKSHLQFPQGSSPLYVSHGDGAYIFDADGNRFVDLAGAIGPVILGYNDPDVNEAVKRQLDNGITFSLSTRLECELAELLCHHIPCAEMVKFGKSGTDVTTAAVKLARALGGGRELVLTSGYHGWADWSMCRSACTDGIPYDTRNHTFELPYGGLFVTPPAEVAAIIVEPNDNPEYLQNLRDYCDKYNIILIFDEIITGFRYGMGGAQELYGVTPDLACFGKAMANGMPISALVGKKDIMKRLDAPDIFYSGTFFGETLSIAAAIATINKLDREKVIGYLHLRGIHLERHILYEIDQLGLNDAITISGWYTNLKISFKGEYADHIRSLFLSEMAQHGVLIINANNLSFAMGEAEFTRIFTAYRTTFAKIAQALHDGSIVTVKPIAASPLRAA